MTGHVDEAHLSSGRQHRHGEAEVDRKTAPTFLRQAVGVGSSEVADEGGLTVVNVPRGADHTHDIRLMGAPPGEQKQRRKTSRQTLIGNVRDTKGEALDRFRLTVVDSFEQVLLVEGSRHLGGIVATGALG
jgi:beta-xylosidase